MKEKIGTVIKIISAPKLDGCDVFKGMLGVIATKNEDGSFFMDFIQEDGKLSGCLVVSNPNKFKYEVVKESVEAQMINSDGQLVTRRMDIALAVNWNLKFKRL